MAWLDFLPDISLPEHVDIDIINIGDVIEGDVIEGDVIEGDSVDGDVIEGDSVDGDVIEGDSVDADYAIVSEGALVPVDQIERVVAGTLTGDAPIDLRENNEELVIDPANLRGDDEWETVVKPGLKRGWEEERTVSTRSAYPILLQAERNITDEKISEIRAFFSGKLFTSDFLLLQSSLTIDRAMNAGDGAGLTNAELKRRKRDLAEKYHDAAFSLPSMCTSGYFDEDELFRAVYEKMAAEPEYDVDDYDSVFRTMIRQKPFVAYASSSQSASELADIVSGKIRRFPGYDIPLPYIDVRGLGRSNHEKIRTAMEEVEERYDGIRYDERVGDEELIVRIDAESIPE